MKKKIEKARVSERVILPQLNPKVRKALESHLNKKAQVKKIIAKKEITPKESVTENVKSKKLSSKVDDSSMNSAKSGKISMMV